MASKNPEETALRRKLFEMRTEHADLDVAISAIEQSRVPDHLAMTRLKKRKLVLKDQIAMVEDQLTPDIIA